MNRKILFAIITFFISPIIFANAPVVDLSQNSSAANSTLPPTISASQPLTTQEQVAKLEQQMANITQMDFPARIDQLQQQVQQLQGQVEVQNHTIQTLQTQQTSFYQDLDQRIKQFVLPNAPTGIKVPTVALQGDQPTYQKAFTLLENKKYSEAIESFKNYLTQYPAGQYVVNSHYWLGEIYYMQNKMDLASIEFQTIVDKYNKDQKVPDALLKLAFIHDSTGKRAQARQELQDIIKNYAGTTAAQLAALRLKSET